MTKSERTRKYIIEQSAALFNQKGFAGTSMSDIMEATGLTKGGLYGNFKSKEEIAVASFEYAVETINSKIAKRTNLIDNSLDKLKAVIYFYREHIFDYPIEGGCPILNTAVDADDAQPILRESVVNALDFWQLAIIKTLQKGKIKGEIKQNINEKDFAVTFIAMLEGAILLARVYKDEVYFNIVTKRILDYIETIQ